jgi:hypothetical protein
VEISNGWSRPASGNLWFTETLSYASCSFPLYLAKITGTVSRCRCPEQLLPRLREHLRRRRQPLVDQRVRDHPARTSRNNHRLLRRLRRADRSGPFTITSGLDGNPSSSKATDKLSARSPHRHGQQILDHDQQGPTESIGAITAGPIESGRSDTDQQAAVS